MKQLPLHLKKYISTQNYEKYTPIDHAVWRYILRQLKSFLAINAHECYIEGLEKTGIEIEQIPHIENISAKLEKFGWRALPVSGFIPPAAFMELQSLGVLPIASDMRSLDTVLYTPAPDIVHEAAGHAPILIHPEFANYLREYAQIAKKAIISKEDLDIYEAIRDLSDKKENPNSTESEIISAEKHLEKVVKSVTHVSEATELSRMNWWTAEYGLIGNLESPKIFGAGLLSSVGESHWCLSDKVKKIPLTVNCIKQTYDITEPQPQLFVTPSFDHLTKVLHEMAEQMAFKVGGKQGLEKAILAHSVNTVQLDSGLQISGEVEAFAEIQNQITYLKVNGPTQLCHEDKELADHNKAYHTHGYSTVLGKLVSFPNKETFALNETDLKSLGLIENQKVKLQWQHGAILEGVFKSKLTVKEKNLLFSFTNATLTLKDGTTVFKPEWGVFDLALGSNIVSVFGGPADRAAYGETDDFVAARVPTANYDKNTLALHKHYQSLRDLRVQKIKNTELIQKLDQLYQSYQSEYSQDWLLRLEIVELLRNRVEATYQNEVYQKTLQAVEKDLKILAKQNEKLNSIVTDGLSLAQQI